MHQSAVTFDLIQAIDRILFTYKFHDGISNGSRVVTLTHPQTDRHTHKQTHTDTPTNRHIHTQKQTDRHTHKQTDTHRETDTTEIIPPRYAIYAGWYQFALIN